jgi:hypothetical protein
VGACQAGASTSAPTAPAATQPVATQAVASAATQPAPSKPASLPRISDVPLDGSCEAPDVSCFGSLTPGKVYTTKVFTPPTSFKVPNAEWVNVADLGGDFGLLSTKDVGDAIMFFRDVRSFDKSAATVTDIALWLESKEGLDVTPFTPAKVGGLTGVSMDIRIAPGAANEDPGCPVQACIMMLRGDDPVLNDPYQWHWDWGAAGTEGQRLYLLDGKDTVIAIIADSIDGTTFDKITATFDQIAPTISFDTSGG